MLWAVHISDGVLTAPWWLGGYAVAAAMLVISAQRVRDEEIPRIALFTAVAFVVSLIHVRAGFVSVHLLLNGLIGIILGPRAALAIFCGLFLQYWLINHGGWQTIGVNTCVMAVPALCAWVLFRAARRLPWMHHPMVRALLVAIGAFIWLMSLLFSISLLLQQLQSAAGSVAINGDWAQTDVEGVWSGIARWQMLAGTALLALAAAWIERRLENAPEFALGLLLGELTVLATVALNCAVLILGGEEFGPVPPLVILVAHLPIAVFEGIVLGFTLGFLAKVKPELLGLPNGPCGGIAPGSR